MDFKPPIFPGKAARAASDAGPPTSDVVVGVAELKVSVDPDAHLVTYALGSCLGITMHDERRQIGGLLHVMLPDSALHRGREVRAAMFVDTGLSLLLDAMTAAGADRRESACKVFGGAHLLNADNYFGIGAKNLDAFTAVSQKLELDIVTWEVAGTVNRTIRLVNRTGHVLVKVPAKPDFVR